MLSVVNVSAKPNFKSSPTMKATPQMYQQQSFDPRLLAQMEAQKKADNREKWSKAGTIAQIGLAAAFVTMALQAVIKHKYDVNMLKAQENYYKEAIKQGKNRVEDELKQLTDVAINWVKFEGENKVAPLSSETTSKEVQKELTNLLKLSNLSDVKKQLSGTKNRTRLFFLWGESGVGKTYVAKQFAQESGAEYVCIKYGDIGSPYKDAGSMKILNMFKNIIKDAQANPDKKYVVCIDEIDALIRAVTGLEGPEASKARSSVLTGMDEIVEKCKNVTVIATSNYNPNGNMIDKASMRRFNKGKIEVPLPDKIQTKALLKMYLKDVGIITDDFYKTPEFNSFVDELVNGKYSNGEIQNIAENAGEVYGAVIEPMTDEAAKATKFLVDYLRKGKEIVGQAAAICNHTTKV